ncbi:MAG: tetratricopeptide repeat protein, partial [Dokdonella sp.]
MPTSATQSATDLINQIVGLIEHGADAQANTVAQAARENFPDNAELARLHGVALLRLERHDEAITALTRARALSPRSIEVLCNLGSAASARGDGAAAMEALEAAFAIAPQHPAVLNGLGSARQLSGDAQGARDAYSAATKTAPNYLGAWLNLAAAELELGRSSETERLARMVLTQVEHPQAHRLLGDALAMQLLHADAEASYRSAATLNPADASLFYQAGLMADEQGEHARSASLHARALQIDPTLDRALSELVYAKRRLIDHAGLDALSLRLRERVRAGAAVAPFAFLSEPASAAEQLLCARQFAAQLSAETMALKQRLGFNHAPALSGSKPRVGLLSNGFGKHPTGLLTVALVEALRDGPLHIQLFATAPNDGSSIATRLRESVAEVHELAGLTDAVMAQRIHSSRCEVLIDLRGYGGGSVASMLALRPAPVQVNWLAYPGTSGAPWIDYAIADRMVLPDAIRAGYSEAIAWLPRCFQPNDTARRVAQPPARADCGLPESGVVYCCFNNSYKFNHASVARQLQVLAAVPDSVLWLLQGPDGSDQRLRDLAAQAGVDPQRLVFMAK